MLIKHKGRLFGDEIPRSEITPRAFFENRRRVLKAAGALAAIALSAAGVSFGQQNNEGLEEVLVTAQRRVANRLDVPLSVA